MSNSNTPNEPIYPPCPNGHLVPCVCLACAPETTRIRRAEAAARAPETATQCGARERAEIFAARRARADESDRLRTFLKDCRCPCCDARARLRAIAYDRACHSAADIHCASTDRRDDDSYPAIDKDLAAAREAFARAGRYADNSDKAIRAATEGFRKDTDAGPAGAD